MGWLPSSSLRGAALWALGALLGSCTRVSAADGDAQLVARSAADRTAVGARCDKEERCRNIGPSRTWPSRHECLAEIGAEWNQVMSECPEGVVETALDDCLVEARGEDCSDLYSAVSRIIKCRSGRLCRWQSDGSLR